MDSKGKLFEIAEYFKSIKEPEKPKKEVVTKKKKERIQGKHYDEGSSIQLSYDLDLYPYEFSIREEMEGVTEDLGYAEEYESETFFIEPFQDEQNASEQSIDASFEMEEKGLDDDPPEYYGQSFEDAETDRMNEYNPYEASDPKMEEASLSIEDESDSDDFISDASLDYDAADIPEANVTEMSDQEFASDLAAILKGEKAYNKEAGRTEPVSHGIQKTQEEAGQDIPGLKANEHEIFEKISQSMKNANAFDLGSITMSQRFDEIDEQLEKEDIEEITKGNSPKSSELIQKEEKKEAPTQTAPTPVNEEMTVDTLEEPENAEVVSSSLSDKKLDFTSIGVSIGPDSLQPADIILSTTKDPVISKRIRKITNSAFSHAAIYVGGPGNGNVIEAIESGVVERSLDTAMKDDTVTVALRHNQMTPEKSEIIVNFLKEKRDPKKAAEFDKWAIVGNLPIQVITTLCGNISPEMREKCQNAAGQIFLGKEGDDKFYCSELVFEAFKKAGLKLTSAEPHWTSPEDLVQLGYNGTLTYIGHLKYEE